MMKTMVQAMAVLAMLAVESAPALGQTADEIVEKYLAAAGGREALSKLTSRTSIGTIKLTSPVGELAGSIEVYNKAPNKSRTLVKLDLTAVGGGQVVSDQRFDGTTGYVVDTFNGNREITGTQLDAMRNTLFPTPLLAYKENGMQLELIGREKVGAKEAYALRLTPKAGPAFRVFIDPDSFLLVRTVLTLNVPQLGGDIDQVVEFSDFRDVDGVKVSFVTTSTNPAQAITSTMTEVKHNQALDDASFAKPAGQ